ncbi:unnamed protein product [Rotaria socialis]|uniref:Glutaredoxin domain-containing protein n=1 Tax=Rotaria socialis TaxID=392032 RepID=A0A818YGI4_9BILA|nr:unnamed protein product [Rotaria socialis]CAF3255766.1 unnamed protein product [Rotaria socialis]CAF3306811.1 unnamed protein product [Rotaria socialis]CAF3325957.1 unnamed protein product [Rotaria socialis]CAF3749761.1 unnamed protein product [Rotaria socialis]
MSSSGSGDKASVEDEIKKLIKENKVMVFSKIHCPYCVKAKKILGKYKLKDYKVIELDKIKDDDEYMDVLGRMTGEDTVPRVFIGGECIGGGDDTERLERKGELEKKLRKANALED